MALDKQRILNELGNVVNQLQSADCGCMGKLFGQGQGQGMGQGMGQPGYGGCCRGGCGHPCSGEPYTMGQGMPAHGRPCMGYCNPAQSYADGYQFMNQNVMQPVIKEVYDDLRSLNAGNTVTNNPLGARMGLTPGVPTIPCEGNMNQNAQMGNMNPGGQNMSRGHPMMQHMHGNQQMPGGQQMLGVHQMSGGHQMADGHLMPGGQPMPGMQQMPGGNQMSANAGQLENFNKMFPGIVQGQGGALSFNPMEIAMQMNPALAKQQPGMESAQNPMAASGGMNEANPMHAQQNSPYQAMPNQQNVNPAAGGLQTNQMAYRAGNQLPPNFPPQGNAMQMPNMAGSGNQGASMQGQSGPAGKFGRHAAGVAKFKEMFPGAMQGMDDVNFDPMEIAIQMNPANKQQAAMNTMQKLMSSKPLEPNSAAMQPVINGMKAVNANFAPNQAAPESQPHPTPDQGANEVPPEQQQQYATNQIPPNQQQQYATNQIPPNQQQQYATNQIAPNQQQHYATNQIPPNQQQYASNPAAATNQHRMQEPQQVYTAVTDGQGNRHVPQQGAEQIYQEREPPRSEGYPNQVPGGRVYERREPIYPVDNSRYNTIGQPIELLPVESKDYRMRLTPSKMRNNTQMYSNVKSTVSKTSLLRQPGGPGRTPSRIQMQQVYNQYKGSQSYTNQHVREPIQGQTASDGRLNATPPTEQRQIPVERVGGDTIANNQAYNEPVKGGHEVGQVGDVVPNKPLPGNPDLQMTGKIGNLRNGLQDMVYTSYPQSTAWSFHGRSDTGRPITGYRDFRVRV